MSLIENPLDAELAGLVECRNCGGTGWDETDHEDIRRCGVCRGTGSHAPLPAAPRPGPPLIRLTHAREKP